MLGFGMIRRLRRELEQERRKNEVLLELYQGERSRGEEARVLLAKEADKAKQWQNFWEYDGRVQGVREE